MENNYVPKSTCQYIPFPSTSGKPKTCENKIPMTTPNWWRVPRAPLMLGVEISDRYNGVNPVYKPEKHDVSIKEQWSY